MTVHAFLWQDARLTDLGTGGQPNSFTSEDYPINDRDDVTGYLDTSTPDPNGEDYCLVGDHHICLPFVWRKGAITTLPLPGGNNGQALQINNRGQIVGQGETGVIDPKCQAPQVYDYVATVWGPGKGQLQKLPPYGNDTQAVAFGINGRGEIVGSSGKCQLQSKSLGFIEAILWRNGKPINLGNLGGRIFNTAFSINNKSEITGQASLRGSSHGFHFHAYLWRRGAMADLGTLPGDVISLGNGINDSTQIAGLSFPPGSGTAHGFLWQNGVMYDMNSIIPKHSPIIVLEALGINNRGQIAGYGFDRNTSNVHGYIATPCDAANHDLKGCRDTRGTSTPPDFVLPPKARALLERMNRRRFGVWPGSNVSSHQQVQKRSVVP